MKDVFCIALIFTRNNYRYQMYARYYAEVLLSMQKQVVIYSPFWIDLNNFLLVNFKSKSSRFRCYPLPEAGEVASAGSNLSLTWRLMKLTRSLQQAESSTKTKVDLVFFAPTDDWIKPSFSKTVFHKVFPFRWTGLLTDISWYTNPNISKNVDPRFSDPDYLYSDESCVGVAMLDRFHTEIVRGRVYKRVFVFPDVTDYRLPEKPSDLVLKIRKMSKGRLIVGTFIFEDEDPTIWVDLVLASPADKYFFVLAGNPDFDQLNPTLLKRFRELLSSDRENLMFLAKGEDVRAKLDEVVHVIEVFLICEKKSYTPNLILSIASRLGKPVIGLENTVDGRITKALNLGICSEKYTSSLLKALELCRYQHLFNPEYPSSFFENYSIVNSKKNLFSAFEDCLNFIMV